MTKRPVIKVFCGKIILIRRDRNNRQLRVAVSWKLKEFRISLVKKIVITLVKKIVIMGVIYKLFSL